MKVSTPHPEQLTPAYVDILDSFFDMLVRDLADPTYRPTHPGEQHPRVWVWEHLPPAYAVSIEARAAAYQDRVTMRRATLKQQRLARYGNRRPA